MQYLELLAPARNKEIGIAAIDCGADAVYIAGPDFGARKAAGNSYEDIAELCEYAHKFGAKVFVTFNIELRADEIEEAHRQILMAQEAGADAFIVREPLIFTWNDITVPLHASTQCAIRDAERAKYFENLGASRIVLERELSLQRVKEIADAVNCELEFFVHGALCVCYSGDCRLSEFIDGRSADRGECIQACRSLYDLVDEDGKVLVRNKAILSLKDFKLKNRLKELAEARVCSFKIEGRLKNASYVKNVVREYDLALNKLVANNPSEYCRASYGKIVGGFEPDSSKTFNRGYTELFIDGVKGQWSSMDTPKSMGEVIGKVAKIRHFKGRGLMEIELKPSSKSVVLKNGDGFAFTTKDGIYGFRADVAEGLIIKAKDISELKEGYLLYRNINTAFEKILESQSPRREIGVKLYITISGDYTIDIKAISEDGRELSSHFSAEVEAAENLERAKAMFSEQLSKRSSHYAFNLESLELNSRSMPLLSASTLNSIRRLIAEDLDALECKTIPMLNIHRADSRNSEEIMENFDKRQELMRSKYCIRHELGICLKSSPNTNKQSNLFLTNNGRRFRLSFDCAACEMVLTSDQK